MSGSFGPSGGSSNLSSPSSIGNITPNTVSATDLTNSARIVDIPSATQTLIATSSIACVSGIVPITSASVITLTSNPQVTTGLNGQRITLVNIGSNAITLVTGNGLLMPSNIVLYGGRQVSFTYLASYVSWVSDVLVPESIALTGIPTVPTAAHNANSTQIASTAQVFNHLYNHDQPGFRALTLTANWVTFGTPFPIPSVKRIGRDMIFVQGVVNVSGTFNSLITTLPVDCRPISNINVLGFSSTNTAVQITIANTGAITTSAALAAGQFQVITFNFAI